MEKQYIVNAEEMENLKTMFRLLKHDFLKHGDKALIDKEFYEELKLMFYNKNTNSIIQ